MNFGANRRLATALAAFVATLGAAGRGNAFELRAWPIAEISSHGDSEVHGRLLGPLIEWQRDATESSFTIRPLFRTSRTLADGSSHGTLLYPLASWDRSSQELAVRFLGIGSYRSRSEPPPNRPYTRELTVFPFVFYRQGPQSGISLSVLPLYANLESFFGYQRLRMLLFPLYLRLEEPLYTRAWLPFPFFSRVGGRAGEGIRVWPIYGHTRLGTSYESRYVFWPFHIRAVEHPGSDNAVTTRISWPFFSAIDGPRLHSRSYAFLLVLPLYTHTVDEASGREITGTPWPFWTTEIDRATGKRLSVRRTPFYQARETATMRSVFYLWPFYRHHEGLGDDASYRRTDVLFVLYRDQLEGHGADALHTRALLPLWTSTEGRDSASAQALTLLDGVFPKNENLRALYAPLYRIYGTTREGGRTTHDALWRMWVWGDGKLRAPWYLSFD